MNKPGFYCGNFSAGTVSARRANSHAVSAKNTRPQFKLTHQLVRLATVSGFIVNTSLLCSKRMFGTNQANVNAITKKASPAPVTRHLRCAEFVPRLVSKVAIDSKPTSGVAKIQNLPPALSVRCGFTVL
jgi:hypothetical protein